MEKKILNSYYKYNKPKNLYNKRIYNYNKKLIKTYINLSNSKLYLQIYNDKKSKKILKLFKKQIPNNKKYIHRLLRELQLIIYFNFVLVFQQVYDILEIANNLDIDHIIRGSAGSCLVCYLMCITDIDPIKENICLSRFMHQNRQSIPDIDIDFSHKLRKEVYYHLFKKYNNQVARISNHLTYRPKSAMREAIKQFGYRKRLPKGFKLEDYFNSDEIKIINNNYDKLINNFRGYSLHCGGIVIFNNKIPDNLILKDFNIKDDFNGKQLWMNKEQIEDADMIKIDLLCNRGLSVLHDIKKQINIEFDYNDKNIFKYISKGKNIGLTQCESRGMRKILMSLKPKCISELALCLALIRPGASKNYQKCNFLKEFQKKEYLEEDYYKKFIIFDDDATLFIKHKLNCDESKADNFRRAFSKNKRKEINYFNYLLKKIGYRQYEIEKINEQLSNLKYYSFCKSHAYSYAQMVYKLAFYKKNYPKIFWQASINNSHSMFRKFVHEREAKLNGVNIIPSVDDKTINKTYYKKYKKKIQKNYKLDKFNVIKNNKVVYIDFCGIIATSRIYKKDIGYLTFCTININDKYYDLVINHMIKLSDKFLVKGYGRLKKDKKYKYIDVIKINL